jgi:outer membrane protein assembly factor BamD
MKLIKQMRSVKILLLHFIIFIFLFGCASDQTGIKENQPFNPEDSFKKANDLIEKKDYEGARKILEEVRTRDSSQQYAVLAKLRIADTYFENESYEEAAGEYEAFLGADSFNKYASYAQYKLALSLFKQIKTIDTSYSTVQKALREFEKLQRNYPRNPYMDITENRIKGCRQMLGEYDFYVGDFYYKKGAYTAAAKRFNALLKDYPGSMQEPEALYYLGLSYLNIGQHGLALSTLKTLIEKFPSLEISSKAQRQLSSVGYFTVKSDNGK